MNTVPPVCSWMLIAGSSQSVVAVLDDPICLIITVNSFHLRNSLLVIHVSCLCMTKIGPNLTCEPFDCVSHRNIFFLFELRRSLSTHLLLLRFILLINHIMIVNKANRFYLVLFRHIWLINAIFLALFGFSGACIWWSFIGGKIFDLLKLFFREIHKAGMVNVLCYDTVFSHVLIQSSWGLVAHLHELFMYLGWHSFDDLTHRMAIVIPRRFRVRIIFKI